MPHPTWSREVRRGHSSDGGYSCWGLLQTHFIRNLKLAMQHKHLRRTRLMPSTWATQTLPLAACCSCIGSTLHHRRSELMAKAMKQLLEWLHILIIGSARSSYSLRTKLDTEELCERLHNLYCFWQTQKTLTVKCCRGGQVTSCWLQLVDFHKPSTLHHQAQMFTARQHLSAR